MSGRWWCIFWRMSAILMNSCTRSGGFSPPGGRVVVVVPNRRGIWARVDSTPFGQGRPYSVTQLDGLLRRNGFDVVAWTEALYIPPIPSERFLRTAAFWERIGVRLSAPFAGLHVVEAMRQEQRPIPVRQQRRRLRFAPRSLPGALRGANTRRRVLYTAPGIKREPCSPARHVACGWEWCGRDTYLPMRTGCRREVPDRMRKAHDREGGKRKVIDTVRETKDGA